MNRHEDRLWKQEEMQGWRKAFEACVEDDARDEGCDKYVIYDSKDALLTKGEVTKLPTTVPV